MLAHRTIEFCVNARRAHADHAALARDPLSAPSNTGVSPEDRV
jgi:hypothetical protein